MADKTYKVYRYWIDLDGREWNYVGTTYQSLDRRAGKAGSNYKTCPKFWNAIQQYGWNNFQREILEDNLTEEEGNRLEQVYIQKFNSMEYGFNMSSGGSNHAKGSKHSPETIRKMSEAKMGHPVSDELRELCRQRFLGNSYHTGHKNSLEARKRMTEAHGVFGILQFDKEGNQVGEYYSIKEASRQTGLFDSHICSVLKGHRKSTGGYTFAYKTAS